MYIYISRILLKCDMSNIWKWQGFIIKQLCAAAHCNTLQRTATHCNTLCDTHCSTHCNTHCNTRNNPLLSLSYKCGRGWRPNKYFGTATHAATRTTTPTATHIKTLWRNLLMDVAEGDDPTATSTQPSYMNESCLSHTNEGCLSRVNESCLSHTNESCLSHMHESRLSHTNESSYTYECDREWWSNSYFGYVLQHTATRSATRSATHLSVTTHQLPRLKLYIPESCLFYEWVMSHVGRGSSSNSHFGTRDINKWVMSLSYE